MKEGKVFPNDIRLVAYHGEEVLTGETVKRVLQEAEETVTLRLDEETEYRHSLHAADNSTDDEAPRSPIFAHHR